MSACPHCRRFREERDEAIEDARRWRDLFTGERDMGRFKALGLSPLQTRAVAALYAHPIVSREGLYSAIYHDSDDDSADPKIIDQIILKLRRCLGRAAIENVRGEGWRLSADVRARIETEPQA